MRIWTGLTHTTIETDSTMGGKPLAYDTMTFYMFSEWAEGPLGSASLGFGECKRYHTEVRNFEIGPEEAFNIIFSYQNRGARCPIRNSPMHRRMVIKPCPGKRKMASSILHGLILVKHAEYSQRSSQARQKTHIALQI